MKKISILVVLLTVCFSFSFGQASPDTILMKKVFGGYQFLQGGKRLTINKLVKAMEPNSMAHKEIKSAQSNYTFAMILGYAAGFMVGWPIGTAVGGGDPNWVMAGIGAGLVIISIPISQSFNKKAGKAVGIYNSGLRAGSFWDKNELKFAVTNNGVGLTFGF